MTARHRKLQRAMRLSVSLPGYAMRWLFASLMPSRLLLGLGIDGRGIGYERLHHAVNAQHVADSRR